MRLYKSDGKKKWLVFVSVEEVYRSRCDLVVAMRFAIAFEDNDSVRLVLGSAGTV